MFTGVEIKSKIQAFSQFSSSRENPQFANYWLLEVTKVAEFGTDLYGGTGHLKLAPGIEFTNKEHDRVQQAQSCPKNSSLFEIGWDKASCSRDERH